MKNRKNFFWIGWSIWICMVVIKALMVFGDYPDFCWDPMFLMVPTVFILIGGIEHHCCRGCKCNEKPLEKD